jgi:hypothetical protein
MRPGGEGPGVVADEVSAVVGDAEVVDHLPRTGVVYLTEGDTVTQQGEEAIRGFEAIRCGLALSLLARLCLDLTFRMKV